MPLRLDTWVDKAAPWAKQALRAVLDPQGGCYAWAGGKGSGKSATVVAACVAVSQARPGAEILLSMDCAKSLRDIHLPMLQQLGRSVGGVWRPGDAEMLFGNGSIIRTRHLDMVGDPGLGGSPVEGGNYHLVAMDEGQQVDPRYWVVFRERARVVVRDVAGQECAPVIVTSGLPVSTWWCLETQRAGGRVWRPRTAENAANLRPGYEEALRASMTEARARAMVDAEELAPEGQIVAEYRASMWPSGSWVDWQPEWAKTRTVLGVDPGVNNPHAVLLAEDAESGRWVAVREWYSTGRHITIAEFCRRISRDCAPRHRWDGKRIPLDAVVADPAGKAASAHTGASDLDLFAMAQPDGLGMRPNVETIPERRSVVGGLNRMRVAVERGRLLFSAEMMRAGAVAQDERSLHKSLLAYRWDPRGAEEPMKDGTSDHAVDALRYAWRAVAWHAVEDEPQTVASVERPRNLPPAMRMKRDDR
jgi:hypothetical protein